MLAIALVLSVEAAFPSARLLEGALREDTFVNPDVATLSLPGLQRERVRLQQLMPGRRGAVALAVVTPSLAATVALVGTPIVGLAGAAASGFLILYVTCAVVGAVGIVSGLVWLLAAIRGGAAVQAEIARVDERIRALTPAPPSPAAEETWPVPGVWWMPRVAPLRVASF